MSDHTATPWRAEPEYENDPCTYVHAEGHSIADCLMGWDEDVANAAFIVKACNAHEALVTALQDAKAQIEYLHSKFQETGSGNSTLAHIERALSVSSAEGK